MDRLKRLKDSIPAISAGEEISEIAERYLGYVSGGLDVNQTFREFMQYTQNTGDVGPHDGPFWEQVIRTYEIPG